MHFQMTSLQILRLQALCQKKLYYLQPTGLPELLIPQSSRLISQQFSHAEEIGTYPHTQQSWYHHLTTQQMPLVSCWGAPPL